MPRTLTTPHHYVVCYEIKEGAFCFDWRRIESLFVTHGSL